MVMEVVEACNGITQFEFKEINREGREGKWE